MTVESTKTSNNLHQ